MHNVRRIHFVGIGGAGMSGIAEVLNNLGYQISGSDVAANRMTEILANMGVRIDLGHDQQNVRHADAVVYSSAIMSDNPELVAARQQRIPIVPRAEMLAELMRFRRGIAIAGTHGKTTTTSLIASVLAEGGLDPTFVIGGLLQSAGSHAKLGTGRYLVAEADESDASFLLLSPLIAVLTNIDADHMQTYDQDFEKLRGSFREFFKRLPFYGVAVVCADDDSAMSLLDHMHTRCITYGTGSNADIRAHDILIEGRRSHFRVTRGKRGASLDITLNMPGRHNALNALAAIAVAGEVGIADNAISAALKSFQGVNRRCQIKGETSFGEAKVLVIDDYGHHPRELAAMIRTAREGWPARRLVVAFQPHRYSRTRDLFDDFVAVLSGIDVLLILDVYAAGEKPIPGADAHALCRAIRVRGHLDPIFVSSPSDLTNVLASIARNGDLVMFLGAGSIGRVLEALSFNAAA
ncbi:MAG: UDP-N-acetylmuramate--L-alanine ligase [Gammaproteobacteria bacterium]|nr:UDP-N-acetylmuramate--L-alanine ligase [Gammaproteobacteria bacterium]